MDQFEITIQEYLEKYASGDEAFAEKYREGLAGKKDVKSCCAYIIGQVKKTGRQGFTDDEIYGMAVHYYDERSIKPAQGSHNCKVVVNKEVKLSAEEVKRIQEAARKEAEDRVRREELARIEKERKQAEERARKAEEKRKAEIEKKKEAARNDGLLFLFGEGE